jgi:hypothetical protein
MRSALLCGAQYVLDGLGNAIVASEFGFKVCAAGGGEAIEADFSIGFGDAPLGGDPPFDEHFLQCGIEQTFFDGEDFAGKQVNALGDGVAVQRAGLEDAEDEHGERAGRHSVFRPNRHRHNNVMPLGDLSRGKAIRHDRVRVTVDAEMVLWGGGCVGSSDGLWLCS